MRTYNDRMFIDTFEHEYTWLNAFLRNVSRFPEKKALTDPETCRSWTYAGLNEEANRLANALQALGLKKNDVVMVAMRNCPEFAFSYIAPRKIGAVMFAANYNLASGEHALLINCNKPKAVLYSADIASKMKEAENLADWKAASFILADNLEKTEIPENHISYEDFVAASGKENPISDFRPHIYDEVLRLCTSGTSSLVKLVPVNDINEVLSAHDVIMQYPMNFSDTTLNMTPWFHRGGVHSGGLCPSFYCGACVVIMRRFQPANTLDWVEKYNITFLMGVPSNLALLLKVQKRSPRKLDTLKGLVTMGSPLSKDVCISCMKVLTPHIFNGYGTTETFWNSFLRPYNLPEMAGSAGISCLDDDVRLVKIYENKRAEPDELVASDGKTEGEIIIRSPGKTTYAYINNEELAEGRFYKGWMYTGDTGSWDKDLFVTIKGRKDDMIVCGGENIYPQQIEEILNAHPKVKDSIVTGLPDVLRGQAVAAYVVPEDKSLTISELFEFCTNNKMLSNYKRPRYFAIIDELPQTATGKKKHAEIKKRALKDLEDGILKHGSGE